MNRKKLTAAGLALFLLTIGVIQFIPAPPVSTPAQLPAEVKKDKPADPQREADADAQSETPRDSG